MTQATDITEFPAVPEQSIRCADWTLTINDFGKIASASITMAPFVVLVGRNNTGKSYAASLIWALLNSQQTIFRRGIPRLPGPTWFRDFFISSLAQDGTSSLEIGSAHSAELNSIINSRLERDAGRIVRELFSFPTMAAPKLSISLGDSTFPIHLKITHTSEPDRNAEFQASRRDGKKFLRISFAPSQDNLATFSSIFFELLLEAILSGERVRTGSVLYIPAARTGLMLAYRFVVSQLIETLGIDAPSEVRSRLPLPTIRFLQSFTEKGSLAEDRVGAICRLLERSVLGGSVISSQQETPDFIYVPEGIKAELPLHVTSSMVTELAPFLLALKAGQGRRGIILEEPEAHLHLSAQRMMARSLAQLVNAGVPVVVTTHSDTFVQQVNNLMQLHEHQDRDALLEKFGYQIDDLIDPAKARGYEFVGSSDKKTMVRELIKKDEGFVVPSLNESLESLAEETFEVQEYEE